MANTIAIFSPKGGAGRTFLATNLAASLARKTGSGKVLLVDIDLQLPGDVAKLLNLKPARSLAEIIPEWKAGDQIDLPRIKEFIQPHNLSGLDFLPVTLHIRQRGLIEERFIEYLCEQLDKAYEYIIIDVGSVFTRISLTVFGKSNLILFIVNPDLLSVGQVKEAIEILQSFAFPLRMIKAVLNRAESQGGVSLAEVRAAIPLEIISRIPSDGKAVGLALNRRNPVVLDNPKSHAAVAIDRLANSFIGSSDMFTVHRDLEATLMESFSAEKIDLPADGGTAALNISASEEARRKEVTKDDLVSRLKQRIHQRIIQDLDLHRLEVVLGDPQKLRELKEKVKKSISNALAEETEGFISSFEERERFIKEMIDEAVGLGPLEDLIADQQISDIMVNNKDQIYIEKGGKVILTPKRFVSNAQVRQIIERIIAPLGRRIDESVPMVDGRLTDGSRVNAIIPPLSLTGPTLTIRKFGSERLGVDDLVKIGTLNEVMGEFLRICVLSRKNIIVSGGTGSGKTTVLNILSEFIPNGERIITIEDAAELKLHHQHWVRLESRPPNIEGKGAITIRELFRNSMRMRPDRIIIGECRGLEALDMLQAMNTGHDGSMTTLHANSTQDVLSRLDSLILMGGIEIPLRAIREMIASAIDMIVHTARLSDGSRKVTQVSEVTGMTEDGHISLQDIFLFKQSGVSEQGKVEGQFAPTGNIPSFFDDIIKRGISLSQEIFKV
ncbi:MAG: ATPase, T2SS/T4P/T4SS family [Candidatus Omnitrophica bacterium]|jgi:septum site-determining protein MinD|nr:ATPase, T2SS/T4P/T4SS family [Candidatus Omnitrophota bacterium]